MRILYILLLLVISSSLFAQAPFEGKIRYTVTTYDKSGNGIMTIYFGKPGMRLEFTEEKRPEFIQEVLIINFDSGSIFTLRPSKNYKSSPLKKKARPPLPEAKEIAGFKISPVSIESAGLTGDMAGIFGSSVLYAAEDLLYTIPDSYAATPELLMINKGKIVLGGDFYFPNYPADDWPVDKKKDSAAEQHKVFSVRANEVIRQPIDPSLFVIPADYAKESFDYFTDSTTVDTTAFYPSADTAYPNTTYPVSPSPKKSKKPTKKNPTKTKQQATRRKND